MTDLAPELKDIAWTGTGGLSDTQSYQYIILNAIFNRLSTSSFFSGFTVKRTSAALPVESWSQVPFLGVFLLDDNATPDGDLGAGDIRFIHNFTIGVQIIVKNNDPEAMRTMLDRAGWFALNQLLRDNTLTNRFKTTFADSSVTFEGFTRLRTRPDQWANAKNEQPVGERVFWLTIQLRTTWAPTDFPDLKAIVVTTGFPMGAYTPGEVEQVKIVYEFTPDSVPTPLPPTPPYGSTP
jgi:hypothetical protein